MIQMLLYFIVPKSDKCYISIQNVHYGPYENPFQAFRTAVDWVQGQGQEGHETQVVLHRENGEFIIFWNYGDAYPPDY
jgi:hypothetical protein